MESGGFVYSIKLNKSPAEDKHNCKATSGPAGICQHYTAAQSKIKHFSHLIYWCYWGVKIRANADGEVMPQIIGQVSPPPAIGKNRLFVLGIANARVFVFIDAFGQHQFVRLKTCGETVLISFCWILDFYDRAAV